MSRQTPRRRGGGSHNNHDGPQTPQPRRTPRPKKSQQHTQPSDYESDNASYMSNHVAKPTTDELESRTNTELNMKVLRRYVPGIHSIISIAGSATVYEIQTNSDGDAGWERTGVEGTMFLIAQGSPEAAWDGEHGCIFLLNRKGTTNQTLDLRDVENIEEGEIIALQLRENVKEGKMPIVGIYIHDEAEKSTRAKNQALINQTWRKMSQIQG